MGIRWLQMVGVGVHDPWTLFHWYTTDSRYPILRKSHPIICSYSRARARPSVGSREEGERMCSSFQYARVVDTIRMEEKERKSNIADWQNHSADIESCGTEMNGEGQMFHQCLLQIHPYFTLVTAILHYFYTKIKPNAFYKPIIHLIYTRRCKIGGTT